MLLALCAGNSLVTGELPTQRPVTWSFDVFFDLRLNKQLSKQSWGWWSEMPLCSLWHRCNAEHGSQYMLTSPAMPADAMLPDIIKSSAIVILTISKEQVLISLACEFLHALQLYLLVNDMKCVLLLIETLGYWLPQVQHICIGELGQPWFR